MIPTAPAVGNALYDALGIRINEMRVTAEKIFLALQERKKKR